jgi:hypothetical protein
MYSTEESYRCRMLYSQINYPGCFLQIPEEFLDRISELIETYVSGNLRIAKKGFIQPQKMGDSDFLKLIPILNPSRWHG